MAERRMFTKKIIDSDAFLDMPLSAQSLYFHLNMRADDDGFVNNPKKIQRMIGAAEDDLKLLIAKRFVLAFANGVVVIKHWRMHNLLRKDRYTPTQYTEQKDQLLLKDNGSYTEKIAEFPDSNQVATTWQPDGNQVATQVRIGKDRIDKVSIGESEYIEEEQPPTPCGEYKNVILTDEELANLKEEFPDWQKRIDRLSSYMASHGKTYDNHYATIKRWAKEDAEKSRKEIVPDWMQKKGFNNFDNRCYDYNDLEKQLLTKSMEKPEPTAEERAELQQRIQALKADIGVETG